MAQEKVQEVIKRDMEFGEYQDYYRHDFMCANCGCYQGVYVLRGRVLKGLGDACQRCGCYQKFRPALDCGDDTHGR